MNIKLFYKIFYACLNRLFYTGRILPDLRFEVIYNINVYRSCLFVMSRCDFLPINRNDIHFLCKTNLST